MPKFRVTTAETVYRRGVVEAAFREEIEEMDLAELDFAEFDSSTEEITDIEEIEDE